MGNHWGNIFTYTKKRITLLIMARIFITKTKGEWEAVNIILSELRKRARLSKYVRNESLRLVRDFKECPNCITPADGDKVKMQFLIPDNEYEELKLIAEKMKISVSSVIDDLVISPLLLPK